MKRSAMWPSITKHLVGHVDNSSYPPITVDIQLTLTTPADATGPVPVIMEFGFTASAPAGVHRVQPGADRRRPWRAASPDRTQLAAAGSGEGLGLRHSGPRPASRPTTARA